MTKDDAKKLASRLGKQFPGQLTDERYRSIARRFEAYDVADVAQAIEEHRATREFVTENELYEGIRAAGNAKVKVAETTRHEGSWADVRRRQNPSLAARSDYEVILRIHREFWFRCGKRPSYREKFERECRTLLTVHGMTDDVAGQWAAAVFDDAPGFFQSCLDELRGDAAPAFAASSTNAGV
jgi:hypothetical protein